MTAKTSRIFEIRHPRDLPFYCRPVSLFISVWMMMLGAFQLRISYTSYPAIAPALLLFGISLCSFLFGYTTVRLTYLSIGFTPTGAARYQIDIGRFRRFQTACLALALALLWFNWSRYGPPPIFGFFGVDTLMYGEYGAFKQVLFPAFMAVFLTAPLEPSRIRRWLLYSFGPLCALAYASRGYLLIMLFQFLILSSLRRGLSKRKLYVLAASTLCVAVLLADVIGNGRSSYGSSALLGYMQIKRAYYDWPTAILWVVSYVSSPLSNMCWIVHTYNYDHGSASFLYSLLPGSFNLPSREAGDLGTNNIVDGVHTYLAKYFIDLWWFGIFGINYIWGLLSSYISAGDRLTRNYLTSAVLLGCLGFIFFADFLSFFIILVELVILGVGQRYFTLHCSQEESPPTDATTEVDLGVTKSS